MTIVHIVLFEFKPNTHKDQIDDGGFSHGFVSHFASTSDRDYYLNEDPARLDFVKKAGDIVQNVRVVDYEMGTAVVMLISDWEEEYGDP
ncbi:predicted protein [Sclerotinia sclerotiorum 1980 UF-70]|uniref:Stress-response A/B barrel domain-containing protein n=1 Tax=Sclerotinia sclerotiorum (strain ATCC 18683 / 1980 / Ss-1) TaxID=665079 RepID=A7F9M2_SCLS1|nr:predicted protein [Sclerotinia sclerotiorum 1980 UF-70]EDO00433.1 predicted protein [Sclerotinia sclerotiorum 1980 UF-70]